MPRTNAQPTRLTRSEPFSTSAFSRSSALIIKYPVLGLDLCLLLLFNPCRAGRTYPGNLYHHLSVFGPSVVRRPRGLREERSGGILLHFALIPCLTGTKIECAREHRDGTHIVRTPMRRVLLASRYLNPR